jgi:hypothetical protein
MKKLCLLSLLTAIVFYAGYYAGNEFQYRYNVYKWNQMLEPLKFKQWEEVK